MDNKQAAIDAANAAVIELANVTTKRVDQLMGLVNKIGDGSLTVSVPLIIAVVGIKGVACGVMKDFNNNEPTTEHMLFAALLIAACVDCDGNGGHPIEFGPANALKAFDDYERLTGLPPDKILRRYFVEWTRGAERVELPPEQKISLAKFLPPAQH
jgi:hypothetical protein